MISRDKTYKFTIGNTLIGGDSPILIQTMSNIKTSKVEENIKLCHDLEKLGCDMIRFSTLDEEDCLALKEIKMHTSLPVIADIHFNYKYALLALDAGVDKIRLNPGNITKNNLDEVVAKLKEKDAALRIGVNSGSLGKYALTSENVKEQFLTAVEEMLSYFESNDFHKIVLAAKNTSPDLTRELYFALAEKYQYPLHIGLTESGFGIQGTIKSCTALIPILSAGIGNTIRISLTDDPREEVLACKTLLKSMGLKKNVPTLISCPTCGRTQVDVYNIARYVEDKLKYVNKDITVAVMGCPVNGPGEAKHATFGIAGGINSFIVFKKGVAIGSYPEKEAMEILFNLIDKENENEI